MLRHCVPSPFGEAQGRPLEHSRRSIREDGLTIEEAVEEAIQNGWPGDWIPVSCWDDDMLASNGTRSLGSDEATEVLSVDRCKTIEMKGGFPNA